MNVDLKRGQWLNRGMEIFHKDFEDSFSCAVCITGVEYIANAQGGRDERVSYSLRLIDEKKEEVSARQIPAGVVKAALAKSDNVLERVLIAFEDEDKNRSKDQNGTLFHGSVHSGLSVRVERAILGDMEMKRNAVARRCRL